MSREDWEHQFARHRGSGRTGGDLQKFYREHNSTAGNVEQIVETLAILVSPTLKQGQGQSKSRH